MAGHRPRHFYDLAHAKPLPVAQVIDERARFLQGAQREQVRCSQVTHVDVVANAGTVGSRVVRAEDVHVFQAAQSYVENPRNKMCLRLVRLAAIRAHRACRVEVSQAGIAESVNLMEPSQHSLHQQLRLAIRIRRTNGVVFLDRRLFSATVYPADYGFIPDTLGEDGDPLDALVLLEDPTFPGVWVEAKPVGVLWMQDEAGADAKVICVPPTEPRWKDVNDLHDLPEELLAEIKHFFDVYKMLEPGKESSTEGFEGRDAAWREIKAARARYVPS